MGVIPGLDGDDLASCVQCGLCLPACPTFRVTGDEVRSPRGRIALMRAVDAGLEPVDPAFVDAMETCIQCRGCEPACPSGVPFGRMMTATRTHLVAAGARPPWWQRLAYRVLGAPRLLRAGSSALAVAQRLGLVPSRRLGLPVRLPVRRRQLVPSGHAGDADTVLLFTGCVMDAWQRDVHRAAQRVVEATGARVAFLSDVCCGALHEHAGLASEFHRLAVATVAAAPAGGAILVDSAGCGAALADYGRLLGTPEAAAFSARVRDVTAWLADRVDDLPEGRPLEETVAVQDPCHLRHVQRDHLGVRRLLARFATVVELDDDGLCCGAGGAYAVLEPTLAGQVRDRKLDAIRRSGAPLVASANPGCSIHLANAGVRVRHPVELVAEALDAG
jgi:glycolate oxidase iron-sulfur subunit